LKKSLIIEALFCYIVAQLNDLRFEFLRMSQPEVKKKSMPWKLMALGLLIPVFILGMALLAAKSDAENKKQYDLERAEIQKRVELRQQQEAASQAKSE
jgi:hypothetical protein